MIRRVCFFLIVAVLVMGVSAAQDGLDLPTELYVLTNSGVVQRFGIGTQGVTEVTPKDEFVVDFGVSPDNNWIAYRTQDALKIRYVTSGEASSAPIDGAMIDGALPTARGRGDTIAWSPQGDAIAFTTLYGARVFFPQPDKGLFVDLRQGGFVELIWSPDGRYLAAEAENNIWWLYRREAAALVLTSAIPSSLGVAWVSATEIVFAPKEGGLLRMDLAQGNKQAVLLDNTWFYALPYLMPDGTLAVFGRQKSDSKTVEGSGRLLGLAPNAPNIKNLSETAVEFNGLRWAPGGKLMVTLRGGVMALVAPVSGQGLTLPTADTVAYAWAAPQPEGVNGVKLPVIGFFIAEDEKGIAQVWRLPIDGSPAKTITSAEANVTDYTISSGARSIVYASGGVLWIKPTSSSQPVTKLVDLANAEVSDLTFSPDGTRIAYSTLPGVVWVIAARGGTAQQVIGPEPKPHGQPQFAPDGKSLLVMRQDDMQGHVTNVRVDLATLKASDMNSFRKMIWLKDGSLLGYNGEEAGALTAALYRLDAADPTQQKTLAALPAGYRIYDARETGAGRVRLLMGNPGWSPRLSAVDVRTTDGELGAGGDGGFISNPILSPEGSFIAGQTRPDQTGLLTFRDLKTGRQVILTEPPNARDFHWTTP